MRVGGYKGGGVTGEGGGWSERGEGIKVEVVRCASCPLNPPKPTDCQQTTHPPPPAMGLYYPERMDKAVVINAPGWFEMPWCAMRVVSCVSCHACHVDGDACQ